jgi:hypothetical protein
MQAYRQIESYILLEGGQICWMSIKLLIYKEHRPYLPLQPGTLLGQSQTPVTELKTRPDGQA